MPDHLSPSERTMRARMAAHQQHAKHGNNTTAAAIAAGPASLTWHEHQVDPQGTLSDAERKVRAEHHRKAYFAKLAFASAKARRRGGDAA